MVDLDVDGRRDGDGGVRRAERGNRRGDKAARSAAVTRVAEREGSPP